jgi:putative FmdB family regulatory protein
MPIYEYRCNACGHELEKLQRMSDDSLVDCPECAEPALKRLISAVAFRLKGSGWYETDFKKDNKRNLADSGPETNNADTGKSAKSDDAGKKESKPSSPAKSSSTTKTANTGSDSSA